MKKLTTLLLGAAALLLANVPAKAGVIDFEGMPLNYYYYNAHNNFGSYWAGVNFGPDATILDQAIYGYNNTGYPPRSGNAVLFSYQNPSITAKFDNTVDYVRFWYTNGYGTFTVKAYDVWDNLLDSQAFGTNYGSNSLYSYTSGSSNISYIVMSGLGNFFTIDDFEAPITTGKPREVPDGASTALLLVAGFAGLVGLRRRLAA